MTTVSMPLNFRKGLLKASRPFLKSEVTSYFGLKRNFGLILPTVRFEDIIGHDSIKKSLVQEVESGRVSHAQMLLGPEGNGKLLLALAFAQYLLCDAPKNGDSCGECPHCTKVAHLTHPDLHFVFPVVANKSNKVAYSGDRIQEWQAMLKKQPYFNLNQWQVHLDEMGKNASIGVEESRQILKRLALKSYSGKYKIMIIWLPERMNNQSANKLLKLLEEPPENTIFLLVSNAVDTILPTIISRTQIIRVPALKSKAIVPYLMENYRVSEEVAASAAGLAQGNVSQAVELLQGAGHTISLF